MKKIVLTGLLVIMVAFGSNAQELKIVKTSTINIDELPEYIIITSENTKFLGGINITIDTKKSVYQDKLEELEELLQSRKKLRIRNQTDLLNAVSQLGYDYVDAYNANAGTLGLGSGNDLEVRGSNSKYRVNMVFRKKQKYRN